LELSPTTIQFAQDNTHRLIRSVYPTTGIFDDVASVEDLKVVLELEGWTNDRLSNEYGALHLIPQEEWVVGTNASIIMAAFCHPRPTGGRFNRPDRGAWYAALELETAFRETVHHITKELFDEIGVTETYVHMRQYVANFDTEFHDVRASPDYDACYVEDDYSAGQKLAQDLLNANSNGVVYNSVRHEGRHCIACYRPKLIQNVRQAAHFEYRWSGNRTPKITEIAKAP
jgi:RES domain-containing protein